MYSGISRAEQNLMLLQSLIPKSEHLYLWCYQPDGAFVASSCGGPLNHTLDQAFRVLGGLEKALAYADRSRGIFPQIIGSPVGMQWGLTRESRGDRELLFVCGPVFYTPPEKKKLQAALLAAAEGRGNISWIAPFCEKLQELPVLSYAVFSRYVIMVHNTLTGQQLGLEDLNAAEPEAPSGHLNMAEGRNRIGVYKAEQALLQMVRDGNINYHNALHNSAALSTGVPTHGKDPLRQIKNSIIVFTTLVSRAAMEGGLSPETAYALGDSYIQAAEDSRDSGELSALTQTMYHDFIYRVHHLKVNPDYSHTVQKVCDFIELSLDRRVRTAELAALVGYTEYYLSEKFKKETGRSISSYVREAKIRRAAVLLDSTDLSLEEISEQLSFSTVSYFIQSFRTVCGETPAQYRKKRKKAK